MEKMPTLLRLSDTDLTLSDPAEDIRGRKVLDPDRQEIGTVSDLMVDRDQEKVRFLEVGAGGILGLGETKFLIPVDVVTSVDDDAVHVGESRDRVVGAPRYDPDVIPEPDWDALKAYYGSLPFATPGYLYPPYQPMPL